MGQASNEEGPPPAEGTSIGEAVMDFLPIPNPASLDSETQETANSLTEAPTLSHLLAVEDHHEEKGAAQKNHSEEDVADLGWNEKKEAIAAPLVGGMDNEELWKLIRRFNKVRFSTISL